MKYARETMFTTANGDRPNAANVVVVMTDGRSNSYSYTATEVNFCLIFIKFGNDTLDLIT